MAFHKRFISPKVWKNLKCVCLPLLGLLKVESLKNRSGQIVKYRTAFENFLLYGLLPKATLYGLRALSTCGIWTQAGLIYFSN